MGLCSRQSIRQALVANAATVPDYDPMYGPTMLLQVGIQHAGANIWYQDVCEWSGSR